MTVVKKTGKPKASKAASDPGQALPKAERRTQAVSESLKTRSVSARVSPAQHREIMAVASANGETVQTLLLRLLREAGVNSITEADLLDLRRGEGLVHRKLKNGLAGSGAKQGDLNIDRGQLEELLPFLGFSGAQRSAQGGLTLVINNYLRPEPT